MPDAHDTRVRFPRIGSNDAYRVRLPRQRERFERQSEHQGLLDPRNAGQESD